MLECPFSAWQDGPKHYVKSVPNLIFDRRNVVSNPAKLVFHHVPHFKLGHILEYTLKPGFNQPSLEDE